MSTPSEAIEDFQHPAKVLGWATPGEIDADPEAHVLAARLADAAAIAQRIAQRIEEG